MGPRPPELARSAGGGAGRRHPVSADYDDAQLELVEDFLRRTADPGRLAAQDPTDN